MIELAALGAREHQAHRAATKESQPGRLQLDRQPQHVAIECRGPRQVLHVDGNLRDFYQIRGGGHGSPPT